MRFIVIVFILLFVFLGCNIVDDIKGASEKYNLIQKTIKDKYGWDSRITWKVHNGVLTHVNVIFRADQVRDATVSTLEEAALKAVASSFKSTPKVVYVQVACQPEQPAQQDNSKEIGLTPD
jgi:hypothetical protein